MPYPPLGNPLGPQPLGGPLPEGEGLDRCLAPMIPALGAAAHARSPLTAIHPPQPPAATPARNPLLPSPATVCAHPTVPWKLLQC